MKKLISPDNNQIRRLIDTISFILSGKNQGKSNLERVVYLCGLEPDLTRADELPARIRGYWDIEGGLHQRLDVSGGEDSSRVCNRNAILVLGMMRRSVMGLHYAWRRGCKNLPQPTLKDYYDAMNRLNHCLSSPSPPAANDPV